MADVKDIAQMKKLLSAQDILSAQDLDFVDIEVPEWKGTVRLRALSADEGMKFWEKMEGALKRSANVRLLALCAVDESGNKLFTPEQLEFLKGKNLRIVNMLAKEALKVNGLGLEKTPEGEEAGAKND